MDGQIVDSYPLLNSTTFHDVRVFAGDDFYPPAHASYKNLVWENLPLPDILFNVDTPAIVSLDLLYIDEY